LRSGRKNVKHVFSLPDSVVVHVGIMAGYPILAAIRLAHMPVDLHQACDLLKRGASVPEALRILF